MKGILALMLSLLFVFSAGCGNKAQTPPEETAPPALEAQPTSPDGAAEPTALTVADLQEILGALDLRDATLSYRSEREESYDADGAIRAENYLEALNSLIWREYDPALAWDEGADFFYRLRTEEIGITAYQGGIDGNRPVYLSSGDKEGWFILPDIESEAGEETGQGSWQAYDLFTRWFNEARAAARYVGAGRVLSAEELSSFEAYTQGTWSDYDAELGGYSGSSTPISCFFTSYYDDVRKLDFQEFMRYFPGVGNTDFATDAEFDALKGVEAWPFDWVETRADMPVPIHKYPRSRVDAVLGQYAGITTADIDTINVAYLPEYDAYYNYTSDFGPGMFTPCYGEESGGIVTLWAAPNWYDGSVPVLRLQKAGEDWRVLSHQKAEQ